MKTSITYVTAIMAVAVIATAAAMTITPTQANAQTNTTYTITLDGDTVPQNVWHGFSAEPGDTVKITSTEEKCYAQNQQLRIPYNDATCTTEYTANTSNLGPQSVDVYTCTQSSIENKGGGCTHDFTLAYFLVAKAIYTITAVDGISDRWSITPGWHPNPPELSYDAGNDNIYVWASQEVQFKHYKYNKNNKIVYTDSSTSNTRYIDGNHGGKQIVTVSEDGGKSWTTLVKINIPIPTFEVTVNGLKVKEIGTKLSFSDQDVITITASEPVYWAISTFKPYKVHITDNKQTTYTIDTSIKGEHSVQWSYDEHYSYDGVVNVNITPVTIADTKFTIEHGAVKTWTIQPGYEWYTNNESTIKIKSSNDLYWKEYISSTTNGQQIKQVDSTGDIIRPEKEVFSWWTCHDIKNVITVSTDGESWKVLATLYIQNTKSYC